MTNSNRTTHLCANFFGVEICMSQFSVIPSLVLCKWPSSTNRRVICAEACIDNQSTIIDKA